MRLYAFALHSQTVRWNAPHPDRRSLRRLRCRVAPATDPATCDEEMPAVVPTGPVRAKTAAPYPFERLSDENPAPQTNPTESLDEALLVRTHRTPRCACGFRAHGDRQVRLLSLSRRRSTT